MRTPKIKASFKDEAALCAAFIAALPDGYLAYAETAGFDILLVRSSDGAQIGIEAKMTLNAKVLLQAVDGAYARRSLSGPDFRAALVPAGSAGEDLKALARLLGICVIECKSTDAIEIDVARYVSYGWGEEGARSEVRRSFKQFDPALPAIGDYDWRSNWLDFCPPSRCDVPEYIPDVAAGASGPSSLSMWKIKAIKICIILERRGYVAVSDFKFLEIDRKRWLDMGWLTGREGYRGHYIAGKYFLNLRAAHPINYTQIEENYEKWKPEEMEPPAQGGLL